WATHERTSAHGVLAAPADGGRPVPPAFADRAAGPALSPGAPCPPGRGDSRGIRSHTPAHLLESPPASWATLCRPVDRPRSVQRCASRAGAGFLLCVARRCAGHACLLGWQRSPRETAWVAVAAIPAPVARESSPRAVPDRAPAGCGSALPARDG